MRMISRFTLTSSLKGTASPSSPWGERGEAGVFLQRGHPGVDAICRAGQEEVDAFFRQQHRAFEAQVGGALVERSRSAAQSGRGDELVAGDVEDGAGLHGGRNCLRSSVQASACQRAG